ncbi:cadmium resistance transporter [Polyangium mundeleinium]|uniref:Cadmium resistance transporter n=1 Tax=Polyangium mundeleinium TaxID=2995306 RepID=A0ABT5F3F4_9BACT|nr:cadmium resistance transporter [Polyangium mundeleinium]MDC0748643.1 cadmium resistance transporter [Polyangium mundeleinium]
MAQIIATLGIGVVVFASTNVDDILLLSAFFSDPRYTPRQVIAGQFLGIAALVGASVLCALLAIAIPPGWIGLLGIAPLVLGVRGLWRLRGSAKKDESDETRPVNPGSRVFEVASITIANGGDNLGVYIPLFSREPRLVPAYVVVFAVMTAVWCAAGYYLVNNPILGTQIARYGRIALPFVLIGLGLWILSSALVLVVPS